MAVEWSEDIAIANLSDEPALSDELSSITERFESVPAQSSPHIVLDFQDVSYINSSNIAQLLTLRKELDEAGRKLVLCSLAEEVLSVLVVSGLEKLFRMAPDTLTAIASLQIEDSPAS